MLRVQLVHLPATGTKGPSLKDFITAAGQQVNSEYLIFDRPDFSRCCVAMLDFRSSAIRFKKIISMLNPLVNMSEEFI